MFNSPGRRWGRACEKRENKVVAKKQTIAKRSGRISGQAKYIEKTKTRVKTTAHGRILSSEARLGWGGKSCSFSSRKSGGAKQLKKPV